MLKNVIGQDRAKQVLDLLGHGYKQNKTLPPVGMFGGAGLGKTHLVTAWTEELGAESMYVNGTAVKDALAFRAFFKEARNNPQTFYIIFIDECHCLPKKVQDNLLSVLEKPSILCTVAPTEMGQVDCIGGKRYINKGDVMREALPENLSFVLATTDPAELKAPVLDRLRKIYLNPYTIDDKIEIAVQYLAQQGISCSLDTYEGLAERSRSIRHLKDEICNTFRDIKSYHQENDEVSLELMDEVLGIDSDGANELDRDYMEYLAQYGVVGLETMGGKLRIEKKQILRHIEPFLLGKGWIMIATKGRKLTELGSQKILGEEDEQSTE